MCGNEPTSLFIYYILRKDTIILKIRLSRLKRKKWKTLECIADDMAQDTAAQAKACDGCAISSIALQRTAHMVTTRRWLFPQAEPNRNRKGGG